MEQKSEMREESTVQVDSVVAQESEAVTLKEEKEVQPEHGVEDEAYLQRQKMSKQNEAKMLVAKAKAIVQDAEEQVRKCRLLLSDDLQGYEEAKKELKTGGLDDCEALLLALGYSDNFEEANEEEVVVFEAKSDVVPMDVKEVSGGRFSSFLLALIAGVAAVSAPLYVVAQKTDVALDLSKLTEPETLQGVLASLSSFLGLNGDPWLGGGVLVLIGLLVGLSVYALRVNAKAKQNLTFAKEQLKEAEAYAVIKGDCKSEMDKVDAHINDTIEALKIYEVLFNEQKGKLERMLYIEKKKENVSDYHEKSLMEMEETQELINAVQNFMVTPMSEEGKLSAKSRQLLEHAKQKAETMIARFY